MGSKTRLNAIMGGADPQDVWNQRTDPAYKVRKIGDVAKYDIGGVVASGMKNAYEIAKNGGAHSGLYMRYMDASDVEIERSIRSYKKQNKIHLDKIENPMQYVERDIPRVNLEDLVGRYWPEEIQRNNAKISIMEGILNERKK